MILGPITIFFLLILITTGISAKKSDREQPDTELEGKVSEENSYIRNRDYSLDYHKKYDALERRSIDEIDSERLRPEARTSTSLKRSKDGVRPKIRKERKFGSDEKMCQHSVDVQSDFDGYGDCINGDSMPNCKRHLMDSSNPIDDSDIVIGKTSSSRSRFTREDESSFVEENENESDDPSDKRNERVKNKSEKCRCERNERSDIAEIINEKEAENEDEADEYY